MNQATLNAKLAEQLRDAQGPVVVCNEQGEQVGRYIPLSERERKALSLLKRKVSAEELARWSAETGPGKSLDQIRQELGFQDASGHLDAPS